MDGSKDQPQMTAGLDLGDKYSYPCASSTHKAVRLWKRAGCAPPPKPSGDASPPSCNRCEWPSRRALTHPGLAGYSRSVAMRYW
jgi:hypothetical protein